MPPLHAGTATVPHAPWCQCSETTGGRGAPSFLRFGGDRPELMTPEQLGPGAKAAPLGLVGVVLQIVAAGQGLEVVERQLADADVPRLELLDQGGEGRLLGGLL